MNWKPTKTYKHKGRVFKLMKEKMAGYHHYKHNNQSILVDLFGRVTHDFTTFDIKENANDSI